MDIHTFPETSIKYKISVSALKQHSRRGTLPGRLRYGRAVRVDWTQLDAYLKEHGGLGSLGSKIPTPVNSDALIVPPTNDVSTPTGVEA
jgi:hypothetical protein